MGATSDAQVGAWAAGSLLFGILVVMGGIFGIAFGLFALRTMHKNHRPGRVWAIAGIVVGIWWVVLGADHLSRQAGQADRDASGRVVDGGSVRGADLRTGDCFSSMPDNSFRSVRLGPCDQPHAAEVFDSFTLIGATYPGDEQVDTLADSGCLERLSGFVGSGRQDFFAVGNTVPTAQRWGKGKREVHCLLFAKDGTLLPGGTAKAA